MNAVPLVSTFQRKLEVSREEAKKKVGDFIIWTVLFLAALVSAIVFFPYSSQIIEETVLLPSTHVQSSEILTYGEVLVSRDQFLELAEGQKTFVAATHESTIYMMKKDGVWYRYDDIVNRSFFQETYYRQSSYSFQDETLIRVLQRRGDAIIGIGILAVFCLYLLFWGIDDAQSKRVSDEKTNYVWFPG
jgi:hypothetical protein